MWTVLLLAALKTAPQRRTTSKALRLDHRLDRVFVQQATNMPPAQPPATFRAWPALNDEATRMAVNAGRRFRLHLANETQDEPTYALFEGDALMNRFALALARSAPSIGRSTSSPANSSRARGGSCAPTAAARAR